MKPIWKSVQKLQNSELPGLLHTKQQKATGELLLLSHPQGLLTNTHTTRASSTVLPRRGSGTTLLSVAVGEGQGQLFCYYNFRASEGDGHISLSFPCHHVADESLGQISHAQLTYSPATQFPVTQSRTLSQHATEIVAHLCLSQPY